MTSPAARLAVFASLLICSACAAVAGADAPPRPLTPPPGETTQPKTEGIYAAKAQSGEGWDLLRFSADGRAWSLSSKAPIEEIVRVLYASPDRAATGSFGVKDHKLHFVLRSKVGSVEYACVAAGEKLTVRWHSAINGSTGQQEFQFVRVDEEESDAAPPAAARGGAPASAPK